MTRLSFAKKEHAGYANKNNTWLYLRNIYDFEELFKTLEHEDIHRVLFKIGVYNSDKHHWAQRALGFFN